MAIGTKEELKKMIRNTENISVEVLGLDKQQIEKMRSLPHAYDVSYDEKVLKIAFSGGKHNLVRVLEELQSQQMAFGRVYSELPTLNDVFLEITGKELRD